MRVLARLQIHDKYNTAVHIFTLHHTSYAWTQCVGVHGWATPADNNLALEAHHMFGLYQYTNYDHQLCSVCRFYEATMCLGNDYHFDMMSDSADERGKLRPFSLRVAMRKLSLYI